MFPGALLSDLSSLQEDITGLFTWSQDSHDSDVDFNLNI